MEYFEFGDLEKFITPKLTEKDIKVIGRQLLEGLQVLHGYKLAHRDLKPANMFVARHALDWWIKLGDFGILGRICTAQNSRLTCIGTPDKEERIFDPSDKDTNILESRSNLANFLSRLEGGLYKEAMPLFQQILEARKRLLGDEHPNTLRVTNNLAESFTKLGLYQEAMHLYKQTLVLQKRILGHEHPDTLRSMNGLAISYSNLGQYTSSPGDF